MIALLLFALAAAPLESGPKIVVLDVKPASAADAAEAPLVTQALAKALAALSKGSVMAAADARALLDTKAQNDLLGCADPRCAKDLGNVLAADQIVTSVYGTLGGKKHLAVTLLDAKEARVIDRFSMSFDGGGLVKATETLALRALNPGAHEGGDQGLSELRTVLIINEIDEKGAPQANNEVQKCVQQVLLDANVPLKAGDKTALATGKSAADITATLDKSLVDIVISGTAKSTLVGKMGTRTAVRTGFTFEIVKVDTGDIIASGSASPMQNAVTLETATTMASKMACEQVKPALVAALARRVERGNRVTVMVPMQEAVKAGRAGAAAANDVVTLLTAEKAMVARATLKSLDDKVAVVDVVIRAGDGVSLGLLLSKTVAPERVTLIGPGSITLLP